MEMIHLGNCPSRVSLRRSIFAAFLAAADCDSLRKHNQLERVIVVVARSVVDAAAWYSLCKQSACIWRNWRRSTAAADAAPAAIYSPSTRANTLLLNNENRLITSSAHTSRPSVLVAVEQGELL
ncbi:Hypothetical predicted protein [Cloeon dipterum]|uniref:Uncharacterized protein n=1 Tax=Cloeon dipterum TaxID=197152 RepID=A0A8S1CHH5_9INSE|nr:Hypothetical predicted protein [Cloeon dipterum]